MSPRHNDIAYHVGIEIAVPFAVPEKRIRDLLTAALKAEVIKAHQKDEVSYAKIEVTSIRKIGTRR